MGLASLSGTTGSNLHLLEACRLGDRQALDDVFRSAMPALHRLLVRLTGPGPDADDLLANTLVAAMEAFPRFRGEASIDHWLASIATRIAYRHFRYSKPRRHASLEMLREGTEPHDDRRQPDNSAIQRQCLERAYHHLNRVRPKNRIAFLLYTVEGRSVDEIAALLDASTMAVKSRIFLARRQLMAFAGKDSVLSEMLSKDRT